MVQFRPQAREIIYGMPYEDWRAKHQKEATPEQTAAYKESEARFQRRS